MCGVAIVLYGELWLSRVQAAAGLTVHHAGLSCSVFVLMHMLVRVHYEAVVGVCTLADTVSWCTYQ